MSAHLQARQSIDPHRKITAEHLCLPPPENGIWGTENKGAKTTVAPETKSLQSRTAVWSPRFQSVLQYHRHFHAARRARLEQVGFNASSAAFPLRTQAEGRSLQRR